MKFSLLIPTRERVNMLDRFLQSIYQHTTRKKNLEILIAVDDDDTGSLLKVKELQSRYERTMEIQMYIKTQRSEMLNNDYYNWLGAKATGDMIWVLADDLQLVSPDWDTHITNEVNAFFKKNPDRIVCVSIKDNTPPPSHNHPKFPCFPMFSREARDACGWLLNPMTPNWGADFIAYKIYKPIERLLEIHDKNYINHISWHTKQVAVDETNKRIGQIFNKLKMIPKYNTDRAISEEVPVIRKKLSNIISDLALKREAKENPPPRDA